MSAYACSPGEGSEPGVGWNWAAEAARQGHRTVVVTQTCDHGRIQEQIAGGRLPAELSFDFVMPLWLERLRVLGHKTGRESLTEHIVHLLWQFAAYQHVRARYSAMDFDLVHHITYGGVRHPTLLGHLGIPLVLGPLGGGERAPFALRRSYSWGGWLFDLVRDLHTWSLRLDPITRAACAKALVIYIKAKETRDVIPRRHRHKALVYPEVGTRPGVAVARPPRDRAGPFRLIYAGRLLWWKGLHLGLWAVAEARRRGVQVRLTIAGSGPAERELRRLSEKLDLGDAVEWLGWIPHERMRQLYQTHDALLFPSLHDSGGNVALEAFSLGLPVICLELGGPATIVDDTCGRVVPVRGRGEAECVAGLADAIAELAGNPEEVARLGAKAQQRAARQNWPDLVANFYADVAARMAQAKAAESVTRYVQT